MSTSNNLPWKVSFKKKHKTKYFQTNQKTEFATSTLTLQEILKDVFQAEKTSQMEDLSLKKRMKRKENCNYMDKSMNSEQVKQQ